MPTGYTHIIDDKDASFEEYIWNCARGMGFAYEYRDSSGPLPREAVLSDSYQIELANYRAQLAALQASSDADLEILMVTEHDAARARDTQYQNKNEETIRRYAAMRERVLAWTPDERLARLHKLALDQLDIGGPSSYDYGLAQYNAKLPTVQEFREERTRKILNEIRDSSIGWEREQERVAECNLYLALLRETVPQL